MNSAKEYLQQVKSCEVRIKSIREKLQNLEDQVQKITPLLSPAGGGGGGGQDLLGDAVAGIADLKSVLAEEVNRRNALVAEVTVLLGLIRNESQYDILFRRYMLFHSWSKIAAEMHYTKDGAFKLHKRALKTVEKLLQDESVH